MLFTKQLDVLSPLWGFRFVDVPVPGVLRFAQAQAESTPVCGLSRLRRFPPDRNNYFAKRSIGRSLLRKENPRASMGIVARGLC